jgi:hypothetical protein
MFSSSKNLGLVVSAVASCSGDHDFKSQPVDWLS